MIVELKHLSHSIKKKFIGSRIHEQCQGYSRCASRIFGGDVDISVCLVNTWRESGKYKHEVIPLNMKKGIQKNRIGQLHYNTRKYTKK
jgi:hypothetical protein